MKRRRARTSDEPSQKKRKPLNRHRRSAGHADYQESQDAAEDGNDECSAEVRADQKELLAEQEEQDSLLEDEAESQNVDVSSAAVNTCGCRCRWTTVGPTSCGGTGRR